MDETEKSVQSKVHFRTALTDSLLARQDFSRVGKHGGLFVYLFFVRSRSCFLSRLPEAALPAVICSGRFSLFSGLVPHSLIDPPGRPPHPGSVLQITPKAREALFFSRTESLFWQSFFSAISGTERERVFILSKPPRHEQALLRQCGCGECKNPGNSCRAIEIAADFAGLRRERALSVGKRRQGTGSGGGCLQPSTLSTGMGRPRPT